MDSSQLRSALERLWAVIKAFLITLAILLLTFLAAIVKALSVVCETLTRLVTTIIKVVIAMVIVLEGLNAFQEVWRAYGSDLVAVVPAVLVVVAPIAIALDVKRNWESLLAASLCTFALSEIVLLLPYEIRGFLIIGAISAIIFEHVMTHTKEN